jgi:hypothetical protein
MKPPTKLFVRDFEAENPKATRYISTSHRIHDSDLEYQLVQPLVDDWIDADAIGKLARDYADETNEGENPPVRMYRNDLDYASERDYRAGFNAAIEMMKNPPPNKK